jgi:hypothetical protein
LPIVDSLFRPEQHEIDPGLCFVLMPFSVDLEPVYKEIRKVVAEFAGLACYRADDFSQSTRITDDIWAKIQQARVAIAVLTGANANVFYEVGLCHAIGKPAILLIEDGEQVPFDLRHIRYLKYSLPKLAEIHGRLASYIRPCLEARPDAKPTASSSGPKVAITSIRAPASIVLGESGQIEIKAKNLGLDATQGYFSVSFPEGVSSAIAVGSDIQTKEGHKTTRWKSGQVILDYPIVEAFIYGSPGWPSNKSHHLTAKFTPNRAGFLQFYFSASAKLASQPFITDPAPGIHTIVDQRDEPVYCSVIEVKPRV